MKYTIAFLVIVASFIFSASAQAQSQFKGKYKLYIGHTQGRDAGEAGYGTATINKQGKLSVTIYWPLNGETGRVSGMIDKKGLITLNDGGKATATFYEKKVAVGNFSSQDDVDKGFFVFLKK